MSRKASETKSNEGTVQEVVTEDKGLIEEKEQQYSENVVCCMLNVEIRQKQFMRLM